MKKTNWSRRVSIFLVLLFSAFFVLSVVGGNSVLAHTYLSIVLLPFVFLSAQNRSFLSVDLSAAAMGMILSIVWIYFLAIVFEKIYVLFFNKIKNSNKEN